MSEDDFLIHRDDLDIECVAEIEKYFAERFPGMKVVFAGDSPGDLPPEVAAEAQLLERKMQESLATGHCFDCGAKMPNWDSFGDDDWQPAKGWAWFNDVRGNPQTWQCPECDAKERKE